MSVEYECRFCGKTRLSSDPKCPCPGRQAAGKRLRPRKPKRVKS
jgi:hypothetical protein